MSVDPHVRRLTLSCLLLGHRGPTPPPWLERALGDGLGGVVLFASNLGDGRRVDAVTTRLRVAAGRDVVVALDEEGGDVTRLDAVRGSSVPGAAALGHLDDPTATEDVHAALGARLAEAGVTVDLAPVADVNADPRNPVIGVRSFGEDPQLVARHVAAAVRGVQRAGVAACAKHFPGHGRTRADSHHEVATVDGDLATLQATDLPPFVAAIAAGARAVMTGHLRVPALDADRIATVSPAITTDVLRGQLGFTGTVITDALEMGALAGPIGIVGGVVRALAAGADAVEAGAGEYPALVEAAPLAVQRALDDGVLTPERLADAARRTAALAARPAGCPAPRTAGVAARCLQVVGVLPRLRTPVVVECRPPAGVASGELPWSLADRLADRLPGVERVDVDGDGRAAEVAGWLADLPAGRSVVLVIREPQRHPWQGRLRAAAARRGGVIVIVDVGWPDPGPDLGTDPAPGGPMPELRTRGVAPVLLAAAADRLAAA